MIIWNSVHFLIKKTDKIKFANIKPFCIIFTVLIENESKETILKLNKY